MTKENEFSMPSWRHDHYFGANLDSSTTVILKVHIKTLDVGFPRVLRTNTEQETRHFGGLQTNVIILSFYSCAY